MTREETTHCPTCQKPIVAIVNRDDNGYESIRFNQSIVVAEVKRATDGVKLAVCCSRECFAKYALGTPVIMRSSDSKSVRS